jgi:hypothetical protein
MLAPIHNTRLPAIKKVGTIFCYFEKRRSLLALLKRMQRSCAANWHVMRSLKDPTPNLKA